MKNTLTENQKCSLVMAYEALLNIKDVAKSMGLHDMSMSINIDTGYAYLGQSMIGASFLDDLINCNAEQIEQFETEIICKIKDKVESARIKRIAELRAELDSLESFETLVED